MPMAGLEQADIPWQYRARRKWDHSFWPRRAYQPAWLVPRQSQRTDS